MILDWISADLHAVIEDPNYKVEDYLKALRQVSYKQVYFSRKSETKSDLAPTKKSKRPSRSLASAVAKSRSDAATQKMIKVRRKGVWTRRREREKRGCV